MPFDQTSPDFLDQLKTFLRGALAWASEEGTEQEHPGGFDQMIPEQQSSMDEQSMDEQPAPVRTRTTTVTDYAPPSPATGMATDPLTSKGEKIKSAMQSQYGPKKGEQVFYASKNKGTISGVDINPANAYLSRTAGLERGDDAAHYTRTASEARATDDDLDGRFEFDGNQVTDKQSGRSYSIDDVVRILFSEGNSEDDTMQGGALGEQSQQGWNIPRFAPQKDNGLGAGEGGKALGRLLKFKAGEDCGDQGIGAPSLKPEVKVPNSPVTKSAVPTGRIAPPKTDPSMRGNDHGWSVPTSDYGTSEGARKRGQGGKGYPMGVMSSVYSGPTTKIPAKPPSKETHPMGIYGDRRVGKDYGTSEGARKAAQTRGQGGGSAQPSQNKRWPTDRSGNPIPLANLQPEEKDALFGKNRVERTTPRV